MRQEISIGYRGGGVCHACHADAHIGLEHLNLVQLEFIIKLALQCIMQLP